MKKQIVAFFITAISVLPILSFAQEPKVKLAL
jgi:hypothetical protein